MDYCSGGDLSYYIKNRGRLPSLDFVPRGGGKAVFWPHPEEGGLDEVVVRSFLAQLGQYARSLSFIASSGPLKQWSSYLSSALALKFLRSQNLIHRDIKPQVSAQRRRDGQSPSNRRRRTPR